MKTNELRLGNWIMGIGYMHVTELKTELGNNFITASNKDVVFMDEEDSFQPIELTEEVLLKVGFELVNTKRLTGYEMVKELENNVYEFLVFKIFNNNDTLLNIRKQKGGGFEYGEFTKRGIKYLHELQNAYFCLTGKELEVNL